MQRAGIFGAAGPIGILVGAELERRGIPFRAVGRNPEKLRAAFAGMRSAEIFPADLTDLRSAGAAARGLDTILYTVGVDYTAFRQHPPLMRTVLQAALTMQVERILVVSSVYSYGVPQTRRVAETHPRDPPAFKGRMRKEQEDAAMEAHAQRQIAAMVVHLPDFYGPHAGNSLAGLVFAAAVAGKTANWLGPAMTPHEFVFVPDAAPVIVDLAQCFHCYGERWNVGSAGEITAVDFITRVYRAAGREPKYRSVGPTVLKIMGWFNPVMKELPEMLYLQETPVILDDSKLLARLGPVPKTPYDEGIRQTLEWMRGSSV
jgi:nucleoside-diphosphate-sugar epimerase